MNIIHKAPTHWEVLFEGLPEWVIPMIKIVPQFYTIGTVTLVDPNMIFYMDFNYFWEKVDKVNFRLHIRVGGFAVYDPPDGPRSYPDVYVDLRVWIVNSEFRNSEQHQLGY
jgi:hypothetical protein